MERYKEELAHDFYDKILEFEETAKFFPDEKTIQKLKLSLQEWFMKMFSGEYENSYLLYLHSIGRAHVRIGVNVHYFSAAMNVVRSFAINALEKEVCEIGKRRLMVTSLNKVIDLNLDAITTSYREEELKTTFLSYRVESTLIDFGKKFTQFLNLILMVALIVISSLVVGLFGSDIGHILKGDVERGLISAIGSLLVLWMMIELLKY